MGKCYARFAGLLTVIILLTSPQTATWTMNSLGASQAVRRFRLSEQSVLRHSDLTVSGISPSAVWHWQGYQIEASGERHEFDIWARSESPISHEVVRNAKGDIVRETIDDAKNYTTYASGMAIAAPSRVKEPEVNMLYGVQRLTPNWVQELQPRPELVTDRERILSEMAAYLVDSSSAQADEDLQMYSETGEAGLQTTYVFDRQDGHLYVRQTSRDNELVRVIVFPNKPTIWEGADPFLPLSPMSKDGVFQSPLPSKGD